MIPQANRPVAMAKKEITAEVYSDDADLLSAPPWRFQRPPVICA